LTLTRPWSNIGTAHRLIILDICAKLFVNPTRGSKDIERTRKCYGQTDRRTDRQTTELKTIYVSPFHGGRRNNCSQFIAHDNVVKNQTFCFKWFVIHVFCIIFDHVHLCC